MNQPDIKDQENLLSVNRNELTEVVVPGTKDTVRVGWIKPYTLERVTRLILQNEKGEEECDPKLMAKLSSLFVLNGMSIFFLYPFYWRYLYYIKGYRFDQLLPIIKTAKKKVPIDAYVKAIILASGLKTTSMSMTKEEIESIQAELLSE